MATVPDEDPVEQTTKARVAEAIRHLERRDWSSAWLVIAAGAGSLAPFPANVIAAACCVLASLERRR